MGSRRDVLWPNRAAVLQVVDVPPLIRRARQEDVAIEFCARPGTPCRKPGARRHSRSSRARPRSVIERALQERHAALQAWLDATAVQSEPA
jgi:hypothetical protein